MRIVYILIRDFFIISIFSFIFLLMVEDIQPGFVSFWFEFDILLIVVAISGFLSLITSGFVNCKKK